MKESIKEKIELAIIALVAVCICFGFLWWSAYQATQLQKKKGAQIMETLKKSSFIGIQCDSEVLTKKDFELVYVKEPVFVLQRSFPFIQALEKPMPYILAGKELINPISCRPVLGKQALPERRAGRPLPSGRG